LIRQAALVNRVSCQVPRVSRAAAFMLPRAGQPGAPVAVVEDAHAGGLTGQSVLFGAKPSWILPRDANTGPPRLATIPPSPAP
jgi:hypothetical protein